MTQNEFFMLACGYYLSFSSLKKVRGIKNANKIQNRYIKHISNNLLTLDKSTASFLCVYTCYKHSPKSLMDFFKKLKEVNIDEVKDFKLFLKHSIQAHKKELELIKNYTTENLINAFIKNEIGFLSFYISTQNKNVKSRIYNSIIKRVQYLALFFT